VWLPGPNVAAGGGTIRARRKRGPQTKKGGAIPGGTCTADLLEEVNNGYALALGMVRYAAIFLRISSFALRLDTI